MKENSNMALKQNDCLNFCSIDAAKGICRLTKQLINIDSDVCGKFQLAPKCSNCEHFHDADEKGIGICKGLSKEDWVYGSLNAGTCAAHKWKGKS